MNPKLANDLKTLARHALAIEDYNLAASMLVPPELTDALAKFKACSPVIAALKREVSFIARFTEEDSLNVLITGETGTGKELIAAALGSCASGKFIAINCAAMPHDLIESELFGYRKGAFTGAIEDRPGLILSAQHGTLFLDEIGDMPLTAQAKLLRVMTTRKIRRVGDTSEHSVDVSCRFVAATHRDLPRMIKHETFREDLYWRLKQWHLDIPPLRDRHEDILEVIHSVDGWNMLEQWQLDTLGEADLLGNARELVSRVSEYVLRSKMQKLQHEMNNIKR